MEYVVNMRESFVKLLVVKVDAKILLVRPRLRWKDNNKICSSRSGVGTWNEFVCFRTRTSVVCL